MRQYRLYWNPKNGPSNWSWASWILGLGSQPCRRLSKLSPQSPLPTTFRPLQTRRLSNLSHSRISKLHAGLFELWMLVSLNKELQARLSTLQTTSTTSQLNYNLNAYVSELGVAHWALSLANCLSNLRLGDGVQMKGLWPRRGGGSHLNSSYGPNTRNLVFQTEQH